MPNGAGHIERMVCLNALIGGKSLALLVKALRHKINQWLIFCLLDGPLSIFFFLSKDFLHF